MTLPRLTRGLRLSRFCSTTALCFALGAFLTLATPTLAQPPPEQLPSAHERPKGADFRAETSSDSIKSNAGAADTVESNLPVPMPAEKASLANLAPFLLPYFNNGPVFGLPGTEVSDFWHRTQLSGDWGGVRTNLARHGLFFDLYSTSALQNVASGGLKAGAAFMQNTQFSINIDTGRAGLWAGGLFHITLESKYGSFSPQKTFAAGSTAPQYTGLAFPGPFSVHDVLPTEYFLLQSLTPTFSVLLGKINVLTICDQTFFGNSYKYDFANFNFNKNPMALNFYNTTSLSAVAVWTPSKTLLVAAGVFDPNSQADTFATNAFDKVNLYGAAVLSYKIGALPGQSWAQFNWTNKPKIRAGAVWCELGSGRYPPGQSFA